MRKKIKKNCIFFDFYKTIFKFADYIKLAMNDNELKFMKTQLDMMKKNPQMCMNAISMGGFCAGFGGDLNGIDVPETFISGRLPPGVTPQQMFEQIVAFMEQTIKQAEMMQNGGADAIRLLGL